MASRRIVVLEKPDRQDPNTFRYVLWADVPAARQVFYITGVASSLWKNASASDNAAIATGLVTERVGTVTVTAGATIGEVQAILQARWTSFQADVTNINQWNRYGSSWTSNGATWILTGVA